MHTNDEILKSKTVKKKPLRERTTNKHRGKYLQSSPDIHLIYDRPLRKRKDEILRNGNNCNTVLVNGKKLYIKNTCAFDSIVEILANTNTAIILNLNTGLTKMLKMYFCLLLKNMLLKVLTTVYTKNEVLYYVQYLKLRLILSTVLQI